VALRVWQIAQGNKEFSREIAAEYDIPPYAAHLLVTRGYTDPESIRQMLSPETLPFSDPFEIADMDKAVARINKAVDSFESIMVYGDYDVDGITATSLLYTYLSQREANVSYMLPSRDEDGYGLHKRTIDKMHELGTKLIITVDNGISAVEEIAYAAALGIDVVITDHHQPPDILPQAVAIVNPHRADCPSRFKYYAGVGVAFKLVCAMDGDSEKIAEEYSDYAALGTIADVVPLIDENRSLVVRGLRLINELKRPGIMALMLSVGSRSENPATATDIAYTVCPRINSAGRLGKPDKAVKLMLETNLLLCRGLAEELRAENARRHSCERDIADQAWNMLQNNPELLNDRIVVVDGKDWNPGVIGIFAAKLCETLGKPCIVLSSDGEITKGSGRSLGSFSLHDAVASCKDMMIAYGGHTMAIGLTMKSEYTEEFRRRINEYAADKIMPVPELKLDCQLPLTMINYELVQAAERLEPFGASNPAPLVALRNVKISKITPVGGGYHQRLQITGMDITLTAMYFNMMTSQFAFRTGDIVDCAVSVNRSDYKGDTGINVVVRDMRLAETDVEEIIRIDRLIEQLLRGEPIAASQAQLMLPERSDYEIIYRFLDRIGFKGTYDILWARIKGKGITYEKMRVALCSMIQLGLIDCKSRGGVSTLKIRKVSFKADLETSDIIIFLKECLENGKEC